MANSLENLLDFRPMETMKRLGKIRMTVLEGVHAGAVVYVQSGPVYVGENVDCDLVLFGDDVGETHFQIDTPSNPLQKTRIQALDGRIEVNDNRQLDPGEYVTVRGNCKVRAGTAVIQAEHGLMSNNIISNVVRFCVIVTFLAMGWIGMNVLGNIAERTVLSGSNLLNSGAIAATSLRQTVVGSKAGANDGANGRFALNQVVQIARTQIENLKLNSALRVNTLGEDSIRVYGIVTPAKSGAWNEFLRWYDSNPNFPSLIRDVKRSEQNPTLPVLQSVWLINSPMAHFADGSSAGVGDELSNNWFVTQITRKWVTVERDGSSVKLKY